jgi:ABC-type uncharacterized transport system involved in gliding motility auxiliary subunit
VCSSDLGASELQVKQGFLGIAIQYGSGHESIPFVSRTDDLEYQLAASIRSLTRTAKPAIGFMQLAQAPEGGQPAQPLRALHEELAKSFDVREISIADSTQPSSNITTVVAVGAPDSLPPGAPARYRAFFRRGGGMLLLAGGMQLSGQAPFASPHPVGWNEVLKPFGVSVRSDMVYDLAANEVIPARTQGGPFQVLERYPFFIRSQSTEASVVNRDVREVLMPWPSSVDTSKAASGTVTPLLVTSRGSGVSTGMTMIEPGRDFAQTDLAPRLLAVQVALKATTDSAARGRVIVVGNSEFVSDQFVQHAPANLAFALDAVDWLAQDEALISIRSADRRPPAIAFTSTVTREAVRYFVVIGVPLLVAAFGVGRLARRRAKTRAPYRPLAGSAPSSGAAVPV